MYTKTETVVVTTDGAGAATAYTGYITGRIFEIRYVKTDFADGSTMTITKNISGTTVWSEAAVNASATRCPRQGTCSTAGVAATYDGTRVVNDYIVVADEQLKIVIAAGGVTKIGTYYITWG